MKPTLPSLANWLLAASGVVILGMGTYRFCVGETGDGSAAAGVGLVLLLAATVDRFKFFKGWGLELQTRELERKIDSAEQTLARLKSLTDMSAKALMRLCLSVPGYTPDEQYELSRSVKALLEQNGEKAEGVRDALAPWVFRCINGVRMAILSRAYPVIEPLRQQTAFARAEALQGTGSTVQSDPAFMQVQRLYTVVVDRMHARLSLPELLADLDWLARLTPHADLPAVPRAAFAAAMDDLHRILGVWLPQFDFLQRTLDWDDRALWSKALSGAELER